MCIILFDPAAGPESGSAQESALRFEGPGSFRVSLRSGEDRYARYLRVKPGEYRYRSSATGTEGTVSIPKDTVYLFQQKMLGSGRLSPLTPKDRRWVSEDIAEFVNFYDWYGKSFAGFGPYVPRFTLDEARYRLEIGSEPEGASVHIDGREWGQTPITVRLEPGKHLLRLEQEGFAPVQTYLNIDGDSEFNVSLDKEIEAGEAEGDEGTARDRAEDSTYRLLVLPLHNTGSDQFDHIGPLFADGILSGLYDRENIDLVEPGEGDVQAAVDMSIGEAMETAEDYGAELLVAGSYFVKGEDISVHAALYDVRSSQVKSASISTGDAGLAIFDTIDEMSGKFLENLDRALPAAGKRVVEQQQVVTQELISYQKGASIKEIQRARHSWKNSLTALGGWGAMLYEPHRNLGSYEHVQSPSEGYYGPILWAMLQYERDLNSRLSLTGRAIYPATLSPQNGTGLHFYTGPQLSFAGKSSELYIGALGHLIYNPPATYRAWLEDGGDVDLEKGAIVSYGFSLDAHMKFYFNERLDTRPRFFQVGLTWDELTGAYELEAEEFGHYILGMMLYMGYGVRL